MGKTDHLESAKGHATEPINTKVTIPFKASEGLSSEPPEARFVRLAVWNHPTFPHCSLTFITSVLLLVTHIYSGVGDVKHSRNVVAGNSNQCVAPPADETTVATIIEIRFSRARAEEALRQVESNSVEMAMDWLCTHTEDPVQEDGELAQALALSLGSSTDILICVNPYFSDYFCDFSKNFCDFRCSPKMTKQTQQQNHEHIIDKGCSPMMTYTIATTSAKPPTPPLLLTYTPNGSEEWIRKVETEFIPVIGKAFSTIEEGIKFYQIYAIACGFDARLCTTKRFRDKTRAPELTQTIQKLKRFGCRAFIKFKYEEGMYVVEQFHEGHNHQLILAKNREFQKLSRNLTLFHIQTIINHSKVNIGPSASFRICKEIANGYENIGASLMDFKNFQRDVKCFIGLKDAEMFVNNFEKLLQTRNGFYFAYELDKGINLCRVFWADAESKRAYHAFGDCVSFDPTYGTNKYCMVFTPFTGVDNHKKSITFGCALLSNEDEESFKWTFVWDSDLEPAEFEYKWCQVVGDHGLRENSWLTYMFDIREKWIPAYFRDLLMGNIMRTTQRSESENSFFKKFQNQFGTLVEFWMRYETTMDQQRHTFKRLEMESENSVPQPITLSPIERHAISLYTHEVFLEFQEEMKSSMCTCGMVGYTKTSEYEVTDIEDASRKKTFQVRHIVGCDEFECNCKLFERRGIICRHIFWVLSNKHFRNIPDKYIMPRWTKDAMRKPIYDIDGKLLDDYDVADLKKLEMSKVWS
ncbi:hypothetical protein RND81_12G129200 [Saponaria officinalis]|uniref:Protein FAR1-RELATED SEQUENCE n=1 Tax=Saponaria officinalis TaxID=3572 RepID=A0AAW1H9V1_SAPOF